MNVREWLAQVSTELDVDQELSNDDVRLLLDLTRDAAHRIERLAGPLTTYLIGVAVGRGQSLDDAVAAVSAALPPAVDHQE